MTCGKLFPVGITIARSDPDRHSAAMVSRGAAVTGSCQGRYLTIGAGPRWAAAVVSDFRRAGPGGVQEEAAVSRLAAVSEHPRLKRPQFGFGVLCVYVAGIKLRQDLGDVIEFFLVNLAHVGVQQFTVARNDHGERQADEIDA